tara:strand:- start:360 stop:530 length:171 start_codon:yes stop_codon:yes gene_type:complete
MFAAHDPNLDKSNEKEHNLLKRMPNGNGWVSARQKIALERIGLYRCIIQKIKVFKK